MLKKVVKTKLKTIKILLCVLKNERQMHRPTELFLCCSIISLSRFYLIKINA